MPVVFKHSAWSWKTPITLTNTDFFLTTVLWRHWFFSWLAFFLTFQKHVQMKNKYMSTRGSATFFSCISIKKQKSRCHWRMSLVSKVTKWSWESESLQDLFVYIYCRVINKNRMLECQEIKESLEKDSLQKQRDWKQHRLSNMGMNLVLQSPTDHSTLESALKLVLF